MELALKTAPPSGSETKMNVLLLVKIYEKFKAN